MNATRRVRCASRATLAQHVRRCDLLEAKHGPLTADQREDLMVLRDFDMDLLTDGDTFTRGYLA